MSTTSESFDCICAGIIVTDHVCEPIEQLPPAGGLVLTERMELTIGGCAANVAVDLAKLGLNVAIAGTVGKDVFGQFCEEFLTQSGVCCNQLNRSDTAQTSTTTVINVKGEDRRFLHCVGTNREFSAGNVTEENLKQARVLYLGGYCLMEQLDPQAIGELFRSAREKGVITILDVVIPGVKDYWPLLRPVLPHTDYFVPNNDEGRMITGVDDPLAQAQAFIDAGAKAVVITLGDAGAVLVSAEQRLRAEVHKVPFVDGTGSGDAFVAGFIYGLLQDADPAQCLEFGSALGASSVQFPGATTGVLSAPELIQYVKDHPLKVETF